jgi:phosphatidate phosphatase PAH1
MFFDLILNMIKSPEVNTSTLSGAIDIIAVKGKDRVIRSSPFYVRFGITKV